jgi:hypothetical protein
MRFMSPNDRHPGEKARILSRLKSNFSFFSAQIIRPFFTLLLSFVLLLNAIGYYPLFKIKQWQVHEEMKSLVRASLSDDKLKCITVTANNEYKIHWEWEWEEEQEFTYEGKRYDVVRSHIVGATTYYYCIQDTQETKLFAQLDEEVDRQMEDKKNPLQRTAKKMLKTFSSLIPAQEDQSFTHLLLKAEQYFAFHHSLYQYDFLNTLNPPPKQFS